MEEICSGRGCQSPSIGKIRDVLEVPRWRVPDDYPDNQCAFKVLEYVFYCAAHEQIARDTAVSIFLT
jgi:hypothetical protein